MPKLDPVEIARMSQLLTEAFGEIERRIILLMVKRLTEDAPELPSDADEWKAEKLLQSAIFRREAAQTIKRMGANIPDYLDRILYRAWRNGYTTDPDRLGILGSAESAARRSYMKSKVRENALHELNRVNTSMLRSGQQKYIDILNDAVDRVVTRDVSPYVAIKEASQKLLDGGLTGFTDRAGRRWQVETATEMIVRKAANDAGNLAVFSHMEEEGTELLLVSAHKGARPLCSLDQGQVFSLKGFEGTVKDGEGNNVRVRSWASSTYGEPAGILGINCRHHIVPFYEGRSVNTQKRPSDAENARQYKLEQEQRRKERGLRKYKRLRDTANVLGDREEELRLKRIIRAKGKELRGFIDEHGLTRQKLRERG